MLCIWYRHGCLAFIHLKKFEFFFINKGFIWDTSNFSILIIYCFMYFKNTLSILVKYMLMVRNFTFFFLWLKGENILNQSSKTYKLFFLWKTDINLFWVKLNQKKIIYFEILVYLGVLTCACQNIFHLCSGHSSYMRL